MQIQYGGPTNPWMVGVPTRPQRAGGAADAPPTDPGVARAVASSSVGDQISSNDRAAIAGRLSEGLSASGAVTSVGAVSGQMDLATNTSTSAEVASARGRPVLDVYA